MLLGADLAMTLVVSTLAAAVATTLFGWSLARWGAQPSAQETVDERDLRAKIMEDVKTVADKALERMMEAVTKLEASNETQRKTVVEEVKRSIQSYVAPFNVFLKRNEEALRSLESKLSQINTMIDGYNSMVKAYRDEASKREMLALQIEEVLSMREEYLTKLEALDQKEELEEKIVLTSANGLASRRIGNKTQHETAELLRRLGFEVEEYYGIGQPDFIIRWKGNRVAIGAHKAFTLSKETTRQRTVNRGAMETEVKVASKDKVPLVILITNVRNGRRWAEVIQYEKLQDFKRFTTPLILIAHTRGICPSSYGSIVAFQRLRVWKDIFGILGLRASLLLNWLKMVFILLLGFGGGFGLRFSV